MRKKKTFNRYQQKQLAINYIMLFSFLLIFQITKFNNLLINKLSFGLNYLKFHNYFIMLKFAKVNDLVINYGWI